MGAAFHNGHGGNQLQLGFSLQILDGDHAAVAHGGLDLVQAGLHVVVQSTGVGNVGVNAFFEAEL